MYFMTTQKEPIIKSKKLICVVGPTGIGKTALSIKLAQAFGCEIISADSRQFYKELEIGTAKPDQTELSSVRHYLVNSLSIADDYDVRKFELDALEVLSSIFQKSEMAILAGGSGLFVNALCYGLDELPSVDAKVRQTLISELAINGLESLVAKLKSVDSEYCKTADLKNPQRVVRALEVFRSTGKPFSSFRSGSKTQRDFETIWVGLEMDRDILYQRIDDRMDMMIDSGLFEEAERYYSQRHLNALQTVGYKEIYGYLDGDYDKDESIRLLKRNSRRYAKRQMTWFKKNPEIEWFSPNDFDVIQAHVNEQIRKV